VVLFLKVDNRILVSTSANFGSILGLVHVKFVLAINIAAEIRRETSDLVYLDLKVE